MKKKYMSPKSQEIVIISEGMMSGSPGKSMPTDDYGEFYDNSQMLDNRSGWSSENWE